MTFEDRPIEHGTVGELRAALADIPDNYKVYTNHVQPGQFEVWSILVFDKEHEVHL